MSRQSRCPNAIQLDLFSPQEELPAWLSLPEEVRQQIQELLKVMLQTHSKPPDDVPEPTGESDE